MLGTSHRRAIWRRQFGGPVYVDSTYDPLSRHVGIYNMPEGLEPVYIENEGSWRTPDNVFYIVMQKYTEALAVIEVRNDVVGVLAQDKMFLLHFPNVHGGAEEITPIAYTQRIICDKYKHVGYILTHQPSFLFYQWPYYLFQDSTGKLVDYNIVISEELKEAPSLSIYPTLLKTEYTGVYQLKDGTLKYI